MRGPLTLCALLLAASVLPSAVFAAPAQSLPDVRSAVVGGAAALAFRPEELLKPAAAQVEGALSPLIERPSSLKTVSLEFRKIEELVRTKSPAAAALEKSRKALKDQREDADQALEAQISLYGAQQEMYEAQIPALREAVSGYEALAEEDSENSSVWEAAASAAEAQLALARTMSAALSASVNGLEAAARDARIASDDAYDSALIENLKSRAELVKGAEDLALSLVSLQAEEDGLARAQAACERTVRALEVMVRYGRASRLALDQAKQAASAVASQAESLERAEADAGSGLALMCGMEGCSVRIKDRPRADEDALRAMDWEEDLKTALGSSFSIRAASETNDSTALFGSEAQKDAAAAALKSAGSAVRGSFREIFDRVIEKAKAADLAAEDAAVEQKLLDAASVSLERGMISQNAWLDAKDRAEAAKSAREAALDELFRAFRDYEWALKGLTDRP